MNASIRASSSVLIVASLLAASPARAQDAALAETLFREAKALIAHKDYPKACPKLAESQRLDPATGTLLLLAFCHEKEGKTATAWVEYQDALASAQKESNADREKLARERASALEPKLTKLTVNVDPALASVAGAEIRRDGAVIGKPAWGTPTPVDPGEHEVKATAPGRKEWSSKIVAKDAEPIAVTVPDLAIDPGEAKAVTMEDKPKAGAGRTVGIVVAGLGLVSIGVGSYFGIDAMSKSDEAKSLCDPKSCGNPAAFEINDNASSAATISTITIGVGLAAVAVGAIVYLVSGPSRSNTAWGHSSVFSR